MTFHCLIYPVQRCGWRWLELESLASPQLRASMSSFTPKSAHWPLRCTQTASLRWPPAMGLLVSGSHTSMIRATSRKRVCHLFFFSIHVNSLFALRCNPVSFVGNGIRRRSTTCSSGSAHQSLWKWVFSFSRATTSALIQCQWVQLSSVKMFYKYNVRDKIGPC